MRNLSFILALWFLLISLGLSANRHYCKGELRRVDINLVHKQKECCKKKVMPKDCCRDEVVDLSSDDDKILSDASIDLSPNNFTIPLPIEVDLLGSVSKTYTALPPYRPPPLEKDVSVLYCVYLI